jgi:hypothetical protein
MAGNPRDEMYLTIKPRLKQMLDRMETRPDDSKDRLLFSSATDLEAARIDTTNMPEFKNQVIRIPRELWDVTYLLEERKSRLQLLGTAMLQKDTRAFQLRNELLCTQEIDAREYYQQLMEKGAPTLARFFDKLLDHKIEVPKEDKPAADPKGPTGGPPGMPPGLGPPGLPGLPPGMPKGPMGGGYTPPGYGPAGSDQTQPGVKPPPAEKPKRDDANSSQITLNLNDRTIEFGLDLVMDKAVFDRVMGIATLAALNLRREMDLAGMRLQHDLAKAGKLAAEKGLTDQAVPPDEFPPGAFQALEAKTRLAHEPKNRISWMAGLLPFLGQENLYSRISFKHTWRDPANWIAGKAVVPEFLDPMYPDATRQVMIGGIPIDFGATHVVGIAGVGLDAGTYPRNDPAFVAKRGIFGYDKSATLKEVAEEGRGLSNTIMMMQVPHDGPAGVTPWIAGGGATIRGVPEKNSIAPFVLSKDKYGKVIEFNGKRGSFAMMADGSVRWIDQNVSDDVFKAMCTIGGGAPDDFNPSTNPHTPLVPAPKKEELKFDEPPPVVKTIPGKSQGPPGWITFTAPEGYSVAMPQQPLVESKDVAGLGKVKGYVAPIPGTKAAVSAGSVKLPADKVALAKTQDGLKQLALVGAPAGVKIVRNTPVTHGTYQGMEFEVEADLAQAGKINALSRIFLVNDQLINLDVLATGPMPKEAPAFFNSLRIGSAPGDAGDTEPPAKAGPAPLKTDGAQPTGQMPARWVEFKSPVAKYSVGLPQQPTEQSVQAPLVGEIKIYLVKPANKPTSFVTTAIPIPAAEAGKTEEFFRSFGPAFVSTSGAKIVDEKIISVGSHPGRQYQLSAQTPQGAVSGIVRAYIVGNHCVVLQAIGSAAQPDADATAFFNSLKVGG